jgi:modulator of FtsH protease
VLNAVVLGASGSFDPGAWSDFAVAVSGAAAALAGLLVVSISINVREIASDASLAPRAVTALVLLVTPLVAALCVLIPAQSTDTLGTELLAVGVVSGVVLARTSWPTELPPQRTIGSWFVGQAMWVLLLAVPLVLAGIGVLTTALGGLYWLPLAVVAGVIGGLIQAWVLLIEILR